MKAFILKRYGKSPEIGLFPFDQTKGALAYLEAGRSKGKVVVKMK